MNSRYRVKGISGIETFIELLAEVPGGYDARITSIAEYGVRESCEFISAELLASCIRTGYLAEIDEPIEADESTRREAVLTA